MACSPDEYPEELWTQERPRLEIIPDGEVLYRSIAMIHIDDGEVLAAAFEVGWPECSVNCSPFAGSQHCVYPLPKFEGLGAAEIKVSDVPCSFSEASVPGTYVVNASHKPEECNYSHSVILVWKDDVLLTKQDPGAKSMRRRIRERLADCSRVARQPKR